MPKEPIIRREDITDGLRRLGVKSGESLLVHSSLSSFGHVEGGADSVIAALLDAVGPDGTLVLPTLTYNTVHKDNPVFDVRGTPSVVGLITEVFRTRKGVIRSLHPTHSCAALGPRAESLVGDHEVDVTPCGRHSPFARMIDMQAKIVFLGVDLGCNTTFHVLEEMAAVPWLFDRWEDLYAVGYAGEKIHVPSLRHSLAVHRDFAKMEEPLEQEGILRRGRIGAAEVRLVEARPMARLILPMLVRDPFLLLTQESAERERRRYGR